MLFTVLSLGSVVVPGIVSSKAYAESVPVTEVYDKESKQNYYSNGDYLVLKTQSETQERALWYYNSICWRIGYRLDNRWSV